MNNNFVNTKQTLNKEFFINNKEDLLNLLKVYQYELTDVQMDYLKSVINLEFSVIRDYISDSDRIALSEYEIYDIAALYNIYNRMLKILKSHDEVNIFNEDDFHVSTNLHNKSKGILGILYNYPKDTIYKKIKYIYLSPIIEDSKHYEEARNILYKKINELDRENYSYSSQGKHNFEAKDYWLRQKKEKIEICYKKIADLQKRFKLNIKNRYELTVINGIIYQIMIDYGLDFDSFKDESTDLIINSNIENTWIEKTETKIIPGKNKIKIYNNIKYI